MNDGPVILFDGVCNLCNSAVQYVIRHDPKSKFRFASLQSDAGKQLLRQFDLPENDINSFVLIQKDKAFTRSRAALTVAKQLKGPISLLYGFIIVPSFIRDVVYDLVAKKRYYWFGKKDSCMVPDPSLNSRFIN